MYEKERTMEPWISLDDSGLVWVNGKEIWIDVSATKDVLCGVFGRKGKATKRKSETIFDTARGWEMSDEVLESNTPKYVKKKMEPGFMGQKKLDSEISEMREVVRRLASIEGMEATPRSLKIVELLHFMFWNVRTTSGLLILTWKLLKLPHALMKEIAGTMDGLVVLKKWILESVHNDADQLLFFCLRLLLLVANDISSVHNSGLAQTVKEKALIHKRESIRALAKQLGKMWDGLKQRDWLLLHTAKTTLVSKCMVADSKPKNCDGGNQATLVCGSKDWNWEKSFVFEDIKKSDIICQDSVDEASHDTMLVNWVGSGAEGAETITTNGSTIEEAYSTIGTSGTWQSNLPKILSFQEFSKKKQSTAKKSKEKQEEQGNGSILDLRDIKPFPASDEDRKQKVRDWVISFHITGIMEYADISTVADPFSIFREFSYSLDPISSNTWNSPNPEKNWVKSEEMVHSASISTSLSRPSAGGSQNAHGSFSVESQHSVWKSTTQLSHVLVESRASSLGSSEACKDHPNGLDVKKAVSKYVGELLMPLYKMKKLSRDGLTYIYKTTVKKVMDRNNDLEFLFNVPGFLDSKSKIKIRSLVDKMVDTFKEERQYC